jgi:ribonucleotide reductase beta subunit family protein with ferritin-like domain
MDHLTGQNNRERLTLYPIRDTEVWNMYQKAVSAFWTVGEVDLSKDQVDWEGLTEDERTFITHILAFFSSSDTIVNINLAERFVNDVTLLEAKYFYIFQMAIENIHSEMYSLLIETYIRDPKEKAALFNAVDTMPVVQKKAKWCFDWIDNETATFEQRLVAFAIVEGVFFSGAFASIYWLKERGKMPGLAFSNELISRDESLHVEFAVMMYNKLSNRVEEQRVHAMFKEAVEIEQEFITESIRCSMLGMNAKLMNMYIEFVADRLMVQLGYARLFHTSNPFPFMERIGIENRTNFFEARVSEYAKAHVSCKQRTHTSHDFATDADF